MNKLQEELKELIDNIKNPWWIDRTCPYTDYCKEVAKPNEALPEGAVGLRVDDDFWAVLVIPYKYKDLTTKEIVDVAFPNAENPTYLADSGSLEQIKEELDSYKTNLENIKTKFPNDKTQWEYYEELVDYTQKRYNSALKNN